MKKTDKKIEKTIVNVLTNICDLGHSEWEGFEWITHFVSYSNFPDSLYIICVFDTTQNTDNANKTSIRKAIVNALKHHDITIKNSNQRIVFDNEVDCLIEHSGEWQQRFIHKYGK